MTKTKANSKPNLGKNAVPKSAKATRGRKGLQCRNLSNEQRASLLQSLLKHRTNGANSNNANSNNTKPNTKSEASSNEATTNENANPKLRKGALLEASKAFGVSTKTCKRIWERFLETSDASGSGGDVSHRKHQSGRPKKISAEELVDKIRKLPPETRVSVRGLARALGMPHTTIHRRLRSGEIKLESLLTKETSSSSSPSQSSKEEDEETLGAEKGKSESTKMPKSKANLEAKIGSKDSGIEKENGQGSNTFKSKANAIPKTGNENGKSQREIQ